MALWCSMCGGNLQQPLQLQCGHKSCEVCLERAKSLERTKTLFTTTAEQQQEIIIKCPLCDIPTRFPRSKPITSSTPTSPTTPAPVIPSTPAPTPPEPPKCDNCEKEKATAKCETCNAKLCNACWDEVHRSKVHRSHVKLSVDAPSSSSSPSVSGSSSSDQSIHWECIVHPGKDLEAYCFSCRELVCAVCALSKQHSGHEIILVSEHSDTARRKLSDTAKRLLSISQIIEQSALMISKSSSHVLEVQSEFEHSAENLIAKLTQLITERVHNEVLKQKAIAEDKASKLAIQHSSLSSLSRDVGKIAAIATMSSEKRTDPPAVTFLRSAAIWRLARSYGPEAKLPLDPLVSDHTPPKLRDSFPDSLIDSLLGLDLQSQTSPSTTTTNTPNIQQQTNNSQQTNENQNNEPPSSAQQISPSSRSVSSPTMVQRSLQQHQPSQPSQQPQQQPQTQQSVQQQRFLMRPHLTVAAIGKQGGSSQVGADAEVVAIQCLSLRPLQLQSNNGTVEKIVGSGNEGFVDGIGENSKFSRPGGIVLDTVSGCLFVADSRNNSIRRVKLSDKMVDTVAGCQTIGNADGIGKNAKFNQPTGLALDQRTGIIYVADRENHVIRSIEPADGFKVTTVAGSGWPGLRDGIGRTAQFNRPWGLCFDGSGALFVADHGNHAIRRIDISNNFAVATVARVGKVSGPASIAIDCDGSLYICEAEGRTVRKLAHGSNEAVILRGCTTGSEALSYPCAICVDSSLKVFVADWGSEKVKIIDQRPNSAEPIVSMSAVFSKPIALAIGPDAQLFVADWHSVQKVF